MFKFNTTSLLLVFVLVLGTGLQEAKAVGGADVLLNNLVPESPNTQSTKTKNQPQIVYEGFKLEDPFAIQLFTDWRNGGKLSYDVNAWFLMVLQGKYEKGAHLISVIQKQIPGSLENAFRAAKVYLFHKVGLKQRFLDQYINYLEDKSVQNTAISMALSQFVDSKASEFFRNHSVSINKTQEKTIAEYDDKNTPFMTHLKSITMLRKGEKALQTLINLPAGHPSRIPLAKTVILDLARQNRLGEAGKLLKKYVEPEILKVNDPVVLGEYYMNLARLLYQAGALDAAAKFYLKVPNKHPDFVQARAELMWTYLRTGQTAKLRGQLVSLKSDFFEDYFIPEIYVVRSISNLKLCNYEEVEKDFKTFISSNKKWAKDIEGNLKSSQPVWKDNRDYYLNLTDARIKLLTKERELLTQLGEKSIKAALPAVGVQPHWEKNIKTIDHALEEMRKTRITEVKRLWKNREILLAEAIKKMKFVKIETMTQVQDVAYNKREVGKGTVASKPLTSKETNGKLVFPYDGVFWPDEVLNLRSEAKSFCLKKASL